MRRILIAIAFVSFSASAQDKLLTMEDALVKNRTALAPATLKQLQFVKGTGDYVYQDKIGGTDVWVRGNFKSREVVSFLTLQQINMRLRDAGLDTLTSLPPVQFNNDNWIISLKGNRYSFNSNDKNFRLLSDTTLRGNQVLEESEAGHSAYLKDHDLYVTKNGRSIRLTNDGSDDIVYASPVHQQEFGITKGTFWSNKGKHLAFYRMDQSMVPPYPIIDWSVRPAKAVNIKYPMAGDSSHHVTVGVFNVDTERTTWLQTGLPAEQYLTNIAWSPDDRFIYVAILNRGQDHMKLVQFDAATGKQVKILFEETHGKYVEPLHPVLFVKNDPSRFIWQSRRDGWNHLYLYDVNGKLIRQLTSGNYEVTDVKGFDAKGENLFFVSTIESPLSRNLSSINLKNGKLRRITSGDMMHNTTVSEYGDFVIDNFSSTTNPRTIDIIEVATGRKKNLFQADDPLKEFQKVSMRIFTLKAEDGSDLYSRIYLPAGFDSLRKYPVIVYWYGGPHAQMINNGWNGGSGDYWFRYMAQRGFVVFSLDTRGSAYRGVEFEQAIFRKAGQAQVKDLDKGVEYLRSLPFVDLERMGLVGWSYGGFLTTNYVLNRPGVFTAAVAGGPVMDWKYYEIMYTERYMDTPKENPEGYTASDLISQAGKLKDKLLIIHGLQDPVVVQQHSVLFVKEAVNKNVQVDYMIYPGHEHNVTGKDRAHLYQKITDHFMQYLYGGS